MSDPNEAHPSTLSDEAREALRASDPAAFDDDTPAVEADAANANGAPAPAVDKPAEGADKPKDEGAKPGDGADPAVVAAEADAGGDKSSGKDSNPPDQRAMSGLLKELQTTRAELAALKAQPAEQPRDFKAEIDTIDAKLDSDQKALVDRYDEGEIDAAELAKEQGKLLQEYQRSTRELIVAESEHRAVAAVEKREADQALLTAQQQWDTDIGKWKEANSAFLENPIRRDSVGNLLNQLGADTSLTNAQVIEQMQKAAFEAFNWTPAPGAKTDPHAQRNARDVAALAAAASEAPLPSGGVGGRGQSEHPVDVGNMKPGTFSNLPKSEQEKLLGEGAI